MTTSSTSHYPRLINPVSWCARSTVEMLFAICVLVGLQLSVCAVNAAAATTELFSENFESPVVTGYVQQQIPDNGQWVLATQGFNARFSGIVNEDSGDFTDPDPANSQAYAFRYTNSGITTAEGTIGVLEGERTYTVTFRAVMDHTSTTTLFDELPYSVQLIAFAAGAARNDCRSTPAGSTLLKQVNGNATPDGLFKTVTLTFTSDSVLNAADLGKDLGVRFKGATKSAIIDDVTVTIDGGSTTTVAWTAANQSSGGESGTLTVTAQLNAASASDVTVPFTVGGTATGADYSITASPITILAGATTGSATITITDDALDEVNETVTLTMGTPTNAALGTPTVHTATITDDDAAPSVAFDAVSSSGNESVTAVTLPVSLSAASGQTVMVDYAVTGGTATGSGTDYTLASGTLTFTAGTITQNIAVTVVNDVAVESSETIEVTLSGPSNATLGTNTLHTYTIVDDDVPLPTVAWTTDAQSSIGESGTLIVTAQLSATSTQVVTVPFTLTGTATGADYRISPTSISIPANSLSASTTITITGDVFDEANETVILTMDTPTGATLGLPTVHTATITDDDAAPSVAFDGTASSGSESVTAVTLPVSLSVESGKSVTVDYAVTGGTATGSGTDYTLAAGTLTFTAGTTTQNIAVMVNNDVLDETNETIVVTLSSPGNASLGTNTTHTYTINDDDNPPAVAFTTVSSNGSETVTAVTLPVSLATASALTVNVDYSVTGGTATGGGTDYTLAAGTLTFTAGTTTQNIAVTVNNDGINEADETIVVTLSNPSNASLGTNTTHTYTITNDDPVPTVEWTTANQASVDESGVLTVTAQLNTVSGQTVTAPFTLTGTASGADYTMSANSISIAAGSTTGSVTITITTDTTDENDETVILTMNAPTNASLGTTTVHTATITDDDAPPTVAFNGTTSNGSEAVTSVNIPVSLSATSGKTVTVAYAVSGGTSTGSGGDYTLVAGTLTFTAGTATQNIAVTIINDANIEADETIEITLSSLSNATLGTNTVHTYTIQDDEARPSVAFDTASSSGGEGVASVDLPVSLSASSTQTITVDYAVSGGSATGGGIDYTVVSGTLTFTPGTTTQNISMTIVDDALDEISETVVITLSSPTNATVGTNADHTYTINDDDVAPSISFNATDSSGTESTTAVSIPVSLSAVSGQTVTVNYTVTDGTAIGSGVDYTATNGTLIFTPGTTTQNIPLTVIKDSTPENNETILVSISAPTNATLGTITAHTYTILDIEWGYFKSTGEGGGGGSCGLGGGISAFALLMLGLMARFTKQRLNRIGNKPTE